MNESTLVQLKIIVERAVRPVRASTLHKRKMREELLAHVSDVFEEESANLDDDRASLERTALRFGNPADVTGELQASVPASDGIRRFWEGRPGESAVRSAVRLAWVTGTLGVFLLVAALYASGWVGTWPREALAFCVCAVLAVPVYLSGLVFLTDWMAKALNGPTGRSRFKVALVAAGSWLFMLLWVATLTWPTWPAKWDYLSAVLIAGWLGVSTPWFPYVLAKFSILRRRYYEEWAHLDIA